MGRWGRARDRPGWSGGALEQARSASRGVGSRGEKERERAAIPGLVGKEGPCRERESGPAEVLGWVGFWVRFGFWVLGFLSLSISFPF